MAWGIYFDQDSNGLLAEDNVIYNTLTGGIMNTGSHGNTVRNNVFALSGWQAAWRWTNRKKPPSVVERNIFYVTQGELFHDDGGRADLLSRWDHNLYWRSDGQPLEFYDCPFAEWQAKGLDRHGAVADPKFVDPAHYDFRLRPDSPALKLGIRSIDTRRVGLYGDAAWVALPRKAVFPPTVFPPATPPLAPVPIDEDFETTPAGQLPSRATVCEEGRGDSIRVLDDGNAAGGRRALRFQDAPGMKHSFNPHLFYAPHFRDGLARLRFDLRLEKGASVGHEWRDTGHPYRVGPSLLFDAAGQLLAGGKALARVPTGTWFGVEIACPLGSTATGTYELTLRLPGQTPQRFAGLRCGAPRFNRLEWLGFTALANDKTEFRLDNVKLEALHQAPAGTALP
jgi:parallel beta-helix repeat protein